MVEQIQKYQDWLKELYRYVSRNSYINYPY